MNTAFLPLKSATFILLLAVDLTSCKHTDPAPPSDLSPDQLSVVQALNQASYTIQDADPSRSFGELSVLDTTLAKAQVVGLGESTHGTHEFSQMNDRLFRYLVQTQRHQAIGMEVNFGHAVLVNRFIHGQNSSLADATTAAKSLNSWPFSTIEVSQLLQWMRDYNTNKASTQQLSFYGLDCQEATDEFPLIREFIAKVAPNSVTKVDSVSTLYTLTIGASSPVADQQYVSKLTEVNSLFATNENQWVGASDRSAYEEAKQAVSVLIQQHDLANLTDLCAKSAKRDQYLAENAQWILTKTNVNKLSLWAHSTHIGDLPTVNCGQPTMGSYLKQQLKDQYVRITTSLTNGQFTVRNTALSNTPLSALPIRAGDTPNSYNYLLGQSQSPNFIVNLHQVASVSNLGTWINTPHSFFLVGTAYDESKPPTQAYYMIALSMGFDVLIQFRDTTPTQVVP